MAQLQISQFRQLSAEQQGTDVWRHLAHIISVIGIKSKHLKWHSRERVRIVRKKFQVFSNILQIFCQISAFQFLQLQPSKLPNSIFWRSNRHGTCGSAVVKLMRQSADYLDTLSTSQGAGGGGRYRISGRSAEIPCQLGITCQLARAEFRAGDTHFIWRSVCGGSMKCSTMSCWDTPLKGQEISDMKWPRMNCWRVQILTN